MRTHPERDRVARSQFLMETLRYWPRFTTKSIRRLPDINGAVTIENIRSARIAKVELLRNELSVWSTALPSTNHTASNGIVSTGEVPASIRCKSFDLTVFAGVPSALARHQGMGPSEWVKTAQIN